MKKILILIVTLATFTSCKNETKQADNKTETEDNSSITSEEKTINFGEELKFAGVIYNPSSKIDLFFKNCDDNALYVPKREQAFDDFYLPFKNKNPEAYLSAESVYIEFVGYISETKEPVKKGEFHNVVLTKVSHIDMNKTCN